MSDITAHPWLSSLFGDTQMAALFAPEAEVQRFLRIEAAWTSALGQVAGKNVQKIADAILSADISPQDLQLGFARDGVPIPALVTRLTTELGEDAAQWLHHGLTSQDVVDTSLMLSLHEALTALINRLKTLDQRLATLQTDFGTARIMSITRMQPALDTTVTQIIAQWRAPLARLLEDAARAHSDLSVIQWGGPIGTRDHPDADQLGKAFAGQLDLTDPGHAWHTDRTRISAAAHIMGRMTIATGKIGEDIALMAAMGPEFIRLSGGISSAMPHKSNPVQAEALITLADIAARLQANLTRSARHEGLRSGRAWMLEMITLPQLIITTGAALRVSNALLDTITSIGAKAQKRRQTNTTRSP